MHWLFKEEVSLRMLFFLLLLPRSQNAFSTLSCSSRLCYCWDSHHPLLLSELHLVDKYLISCDWQHLSWELGTPLNFIITRYAEGGGVSVSLFHPFCLFLGLQDADSWATQHHWLLRCRLLGYIVSLVARTLMIGLHSNWLEGCR